MSVRGKKLPPPLTTLDAIDRVAYETMVRARDQVTPIVTQQVPRHSGQLAIAMRPKVRRTKTGAMLSIGPTRNTKHGNVTAAKVVRWVNVGTGIYRVTPGPHHRITGHGLKRLRLPSGRRVWSVAGQHANPFMARIRASASWRIEGLQYQGALAAARAVERLYR